MRSVRGIPDLQTTQLLFYHSVSLHDFTPTEDCTTGDKQRARSQSAISRSCAMATAVAPTKTRQFCFQSVNIREGCTTRHVWRLHGAEAPLNWRNPRDPLSSAGPPGIYISRCVARSHRSLAMGAFRRESCFLSLFFTYLSTPVLGTL